MSNEHQCIVIDNGSGVIKYGFAGDDDPEKTIPCHCVIEESLSKSTMFGDELDKLSFTEQYTMKTPISRGVIEDWDLMEKFWAHILTSLNYTAADNLSVFLTEAVHASQSSREIILQYMFETFCARQTYISLQDILALYSMGKKSGVVVNVGFGLTSVVPVFEGYAIPYGMKKCPYAGSDLTALVARYLQDSCESLKTLPSHALIRVAQDLKHSSCVLPCGESAEQYANVMDFIQQEELKEKTEYTLPDGTTIQLNEETKSFFQTCMLHLFRSQYTSDFQQQFLTKYTPADQRLDSVVIPAAVYDAITLCDVDFHKDFFQNIVLAGGNTSVKHFADCLASELMSAYVPTTTKINVLANSNACNGAWFGGSILASLSIFQNAWITKDEYNESGPTIVHRKCIN